MANRLVDLTHAPVSHRKQRRRPQAAERLWRCLCLCGNERVTTADKLRDSPRPHPQHVYRNHPSTGDTMNDPTKQDDEVALPTPSVSKPSRRLAAKYRAQQNARLWHVVRQNGASKAAKRVAANAPEMQQYERTTEAAMFWTLFYLSIAGCAIGSVSHWLRKN